MADAQDANTRQQVLDLVVEKGPVTASAIARILGLTTAAVRRHITILMESGEIAEHEPGTVAKRGRGRPARHYIATERAHMHLAEGYSDLAVKALRHLGQVGGEEAVDSFAAARSREIERRYAPIVRDAGKDPRVRAQALADALTQDGYAATVREIANGTFAVPGALPHPARGGGLPPAVRRRDPGVLPPARRPRPTTRHARGRRARVHHAHPGGHAHHPPRSAGGAAQVSKRAEHIDERLTPL